MADWSPWYTTGTVAIANAGTTVTGVGTNFHTAGLRPGDMITNASMTAWAVITATPTTATSLAITSWGGAALPAGSPYRILRVSDADRLIAAHADLMAALVPNLTSLGGLTLAANKGIHATGAGALATHDLTAFGRALAGLTGANGKIPVATAAGAAAMRDIVGTVSQSGGVPTGALMEYGANANGVYARYANGVQICWNASAGLVNTLNASGALFMSGSVSWAYPAEFAVAPVVLPSRGGSASGLRWVSLGTVSATSAALYAVSTTSGTTEAAISAAAIGRWF